VLNVSIIRCDIAHMVKVSVLVHVICYVNVTRLYDVIMLFELNVLSSCFWGSN
jgi:hypothetical protein